MFRIFKQKYQLKKINLQSVIKNFLRGTRGWEGATGLSWGFNMLV